MSVKTYVYVYIRSKLDKQSIFTRVLKEQESPGITFNVICFI